MKFPKTTPERFPYNQCCPCDRNQKSLTLLPNWQGRPQRLLGARKRILAQHLLKRG
jgi:hypothetical protein